MSGPQAEVDFSGLVRPGDALLWGQSHAEPTTLIRALLAQRASLRPLRVFLGIGQSGLLTPEHADAFTLSAYCGSGPNRVLAQAGMLDVLPCHYSQLTAMLASGALPVDVVLLQLSPADAQGRHSLGLAREYLPAALRRARVVIGEVHPDVPWTHGGPTLRAQDIDLLVDSRHPLPSLNLGEASPVEQAIGRLVAEIVEDGATLQTGIGALPDAVLAALTGHRDLGLHTGAAGEGVALLAASGALTHARKTIDPGKAVAGVLIGGARLRRLVHDNPDFELRESDYTHGPEVLARIGRLVAINAAIEVDLTGQTNCEVAAGTYVGAVGGALDFARGAQRSPGGLPITVLPSTAGARSRIVARLSGPVTIPRSDAGIVVTEYGRADLRGQTLLERQRRMIAIAHPAHRETLERHAREHSVLT